jgi:hypothetical protein
MNEDVLTGGEVEYIVTEAEGINDYNSIRWFCKGVECLATDIEMVIYVDEVSE